MGTTRAARAVEDLYRRHVGDVYRYAYAMLGNRPDAEDVAQTTFMNALRALERGERPRKPSNWLLAIAHNVVRQRFRQAQARPIEVELSSELAGAERDDGERPTVEEMLQALGRIPPLQREAIVLREFEGRAYAEIARMLDITTSALETLLFRARRSLAEQLEAALTCEQAERAISRQLDKRLSRKERRRLDQHLQECTSCARFELIQRRGRRSFKALALLPVPASLTLFKGAPSAAAAAALPTIGAATAGAGAGSAAGGLAGGIALKAAVAVAAVGIAGGAGYTGVRELRETDSRPTTRAQPVEATGRTTATTATTRRIVSSGPPAATGGDTAATVAATQRPRERGAKGRGSERARSVRAQAPTSTKPERFHSAVGVRDIVPGKLAAQRANGAGAKKAAATATAARKKAKKPNPVAAAAHEKPPKAKKLAGGSKNDPGGKKQSDPAAVGATAAEKTPPGQVRHAEQPPVATAEATEPAKTPGKPEEPPGKPEDPGPPSGQPEKTGAEKKS